MKKINAQIKAEITKSIMNSSFSVKLLTKQEYENYMTETRSNEIRSNEMCSCQEYFLMIRLFYSPFYIWN